MSGIALLFLILIFGILLISLAFCGIVNAKYGKSDDEE